MNTDPATSSVSSRSVFLSVFCCLLSILLFSGCAMFRASIKEGDPLEASKLTAQFDQHDLYEMAEQIMQDILDHPFPPAGTTPIVAPLGIANNTKSHLDMMALENTLTTKLLNTGRMQFINTARRDDLLKEQGFQITNCTDATKVQVGRQLGARYMLTGSITELGAHTGKQVRVSKKTDVYYQLTVEITDIETGLIVLRKQRDRLRRASRPIIGW
jgi:uncharacterized protein (TIGR02722 family)